MYRQCFYFARDPSLRKHSRSSKAASPHIVYVRGKLRKVNCPTQSAREWNADAYHRVSGPQVGWGKKVLSRVQLRGDEVLLDAGCGTGRLTQDLLQALPQGRVVAVDLSQNMLRTAREHLAPQFRGKVTFLAADLADLPFERAFEGIFSTAAFHWVTDHDRLFRSLFRALRPGGWLIAQSGGGPNLARLRERVRKLIATPKYSPFLGHYREPWEYASAETTAERLRRAGFIAIATSLEPAPTVFESDARFSEFIRNVVLHRHLEFIPQAHLRDQFIQELTRQAASDDPAYGLDYWRLNLEGRVPAS